jgi:hypothetical protein
VPVQFLNANTTYASFQQDARAIDPAGFKDRPKEPLGVAVFALALPSPAFPASRLEATRPVLRVGATRVQAVIPGSTFQDANDVPPPAAPPMPPAVVTNPASDAPPVVAPGPAPDPGPPGPPMQVIYPVPVYTGIVVLNPPEHPDYSRRNPNLPAPKSTTPPPLAPALGPVPGGGPRPATGSTPTSGVTKPTTKPSPTPPAGQPGAPGPTPTTTTSAPPAPPRVIQPAPRPSPPTGERPLPVPIPVGRELPKVAKPESTPANKPEAKPAADTKSDTAQAKKQ